MQELLSWEQQSDADAMVRRLPDLHQDDHHQLRLKLGRIPLQPQKAISALLD